MFFRKKIARADRMPVSEPATIVLQHGDPTPIAGTLTDLSKSGAGIRLAQFVMRGLEVEVRWREGLLRGEVQYCRPAPDGGFRVGLRLRMIQLEAEVARR